ncbi:Zona pellucida sperm-binding protein 1 [Merluccius polli]|uniref:Zona pellucida sperm-binding protein 4 n=1 Tax=Merluccius polli TaxID=89951 RepID=A0AA47N5Q2_MERPO|nr:Zona pellucida sperm-binding protein 1 [Merluccius polli]
MARHLSATLVVALVLLRCCAGTVHRPIIIQHRRQSSKGQYNDPEQLKGVPVPQQPNTKLPQLPPAPAQNCDVAIGQRVPCGAPDISASACNAISCCFDNNGCFYGKAVTVQCTKDAHFIVVVARDATLPNIDLESIALLGSGAGCTYVDSNSAFAIFHFPVLACGSVVMEEPGVIIYENRMSSSYEVDAGLLGSVTRDSSYELLFQCRYLGTSVETLVVDVIPLQTGPLPVAAFGPIQAELRLANGKCVTKGCDEVDAAYSSFYVDSDYPVIKALREQVFIELRLLDKTDPNLVLTLGRCWTTTTPNPHNLPQWDICVDGCPYKGDRYLSSLIPVDASSGIDFPSHYRRVMFKMFTFVEQNAMTPLKKQVEQNAMTPLKEQVYIHCSIAVCTPGPGESCQVNCPRRNKRGTSGSTVEKAQKIVVTSGLLEIIANDE